MPDALQPMPGAHRSALGWFAAQLRARFYFGKIGTGDRLPSVRGLAQHLGVSPTTTLELYRALESQGIIESRQRSGMFLRTVGVEPERSRADGAVFRLVAATASKLRLTGACPDDFATLLLQYTGHSPRTDFKIGYLGTQESVELVQRQLAAHMRFPLPVVRIPPSLSPRELRVQVTAQSVRCLVGSFLAAEVGVRLAQDLDLPFVILKLSPETAAILQPPPGERRFIVVRDRDTAEGLRRVYCALCDADADRRVADRSAPAGHQDAALPCERGAHERRPVVHFAALDEESRLAEFEREADIVYATITSIAAVKARFGARRIATFPVAMSDHTVNDILYHCLFAETPARVLAMGGRRA